MIVAGAQTLTGAEALIVSLERRGVDTVFGIPGEHTIEIYRALGHSSIRHITARHEQGAGFMADGYARAGERPGVCIVVTGPGLTNVATPLAQAYSDSVPLLVLSGQIRSEWLGRGGRHFHELRDQFGFSQSLVNWTERVRTPADIPSAINRVFEAFGAGRCRGAVLEFPQDVLEAEEHVEFPPAEAPAATTPDAAAIDQAARLLASARRSALVLGGGARAAGRHALSLAERCGMPVLMTWRGAGAVPSTHPLVVGGGLEMQVAHHFLQTCDVVVVVGSELAQTDFWPSFPALAGPLIQIDVDPTVIGRANPVEVGIVSDAATGLSALVDALGPRPPFSAFGAERASTLRTELDRQAAAAAAPYRPFVTALRSAFPRDGILAVDLTGPTYWAVPRFFSMDGPNQLLMSGLGTLGYAVPGAIGASLAQPQRQVAALVGDGGFLFTAEELLVAAELELNLVILVWNNGGYGDIRRELLARSARPIGVDLRPPDFAALSRAYGADFHRLESLSVLTELLRLAATRRGPTLIEIPASV